MCKLHVARDSARQVAALRLAMPRAHFTHRKRRAASSSSGAVEEHEWDAGIELTDLKRRNDELTDEIDVLHSPFNATSVPNMKQADEEAVGPATSEVMSPWDAFHVWSKPSSTIESVALAGGFHSMSFSTVTP